MTVSVDYDYKKYDNGKGAIEPIKATVHYEICQEGSAKPIALAIHGGGYCVGSREMIPRAQVEYLTRNNFVVVSVDHRLCPNVTWEEGPRGDTIDAYHWCRNQLPKLLKQDRDLDVDGTKICAFGHSSGSHLALLLGAEDPKPLALLDFYGTMYLDDPFWYAPMNVAVPDFDSEFLEQIHDQAVATTVEPDKLPKDQEHGTDVRMAWLMNTVKRGELISTVLPRATGPADATRMFSKDYPPTFFCLGTEDERRSIDLLKRAYNTLKDLGVEVVLSLVEGGHAYDTMLGENDARWKNAVQPGLDFLISHCQPRTTLWANRRTGIWGQTS